MFPKVFQSSHQISSGNSERLMEDSFGPMQSIQQESMAKASLIDRLSNVLEELFGDDIFGSVDDDFADDIFALEPTPLDASRMNVVDRLPLNLNNVQDHHISIFREMYSSKNNTEHGHLPFSHRTFTVMPCDASDPSNSDASWKLKRRLDGGVEQSIPKRELGEQEEKEAQRFRPYQTELWKAKFAELMEFKQQKGHCCVPNAFETNPALACWVKRQRHQYKLKIEGKESTVTDERFVVLDEHGFIWDSHGAAWQQRWNELAEYTELHGNCNVPTNHASNPQLATWIKCQRRQYKLYSEGKANTMTPERLDGLESIGFEWELRRSSKSKSIDGQDVQRV
jgi:hypothetical protein